MKSNESISHENKSTNDIKYVEDFSAKLYSSGVEQIYVNQVQHFLLEWISSYIKNIQRSERKIHESNLKKFEDFVDDCLNLNSMMRNSLNQFLLQLKIVHSIINKIKSNCVKSLQTRPLNAGSDGRNEKRAEINQTNGDVTTNKEESSIQTTFFRVACEVFSTRNTIGTN